MTLTFDHFLKFDIGHNFLKILKASILYIIISCDKIFLLVSKYLSLWSWPLLELAIIGGIVFHKHILFKFWMNFCYFFYYLSLGKWVALHLKKLESSLHPRLLCAKFCWNCVVFQEKRWKCEKFKVRQTVIRKVQVS